MKRKKNFLFLVLITASIFVFNNLFASDFDKNFFSSRRKSIMENMKDGIAIFRNSEMSTRSNDINYYPYRTNSDFYYLTGYEDPEAAFILLPKEKKFIMFVTPKNAATAKWYGEIPGIEGAMKFYGADTAFAFSDFEKELPKYIGANKKIYYDIHNKKIQELINPFIINSFETKSVEDINQYIHEMRLIKDSQDIKSIRKAVEITCNAFTEVMKAVEPGMYEYQIGAMFSFLFENNNSSGKSFETIIASGSNATVYHYSKLNRQTQSGDLVMMDMGAEYMNYASDITRVIPVNGKFTANQQAIYEIVLAMQNIVIANMKPGNTLNECYKKAEVVAKEGLYKLGLITDPNTKWQHYLYYFPFICHSMGLDVHDVSNYDYSSVPLKAEMVFAVEPLLYVGDNLVESFRLTAMRRFSVSEKEVDAFLTEIKPTFESFKNVAARIEDDVLITETGNEILSIKLPKSIKDIEKTMAEKNNLTNKWSK